MNDYDSDIDIAMHICHHQLYWEKKNENDNDGITWTRSEYVDYVSEQIDNIPVATKFLECFRHAATGPARPVRQVATPNDQPRGQPETEDDKKINALREEISQRFKKHLEKAKNQEETSASESEVPKRKIQPKPMPKKQKSTAGTVDSAEASDSTATASAVDLQARSPWGHRRAVIRSAARRETSTQAKNSSETRMPRRSFILSLKRIPKKLRGSSVRLVHNAALILRTADVQRPCSGAIPAA